jgi:hypothetical protein
MQQLVSHSTDFPEIYYFSIFRNFVVKNQVTLKSDKNKGHITWKPMNIYDHISLISP